MNSLPMASFMLHLPFCWDISGDWSRDFTWMTLCQFHTNHYQWEEKRLEHIYFLLSRKMNIYLICQCGHLMCIVLINEIWLDWDWGFLKFNERPGPLKAHYQSKTPLNEEGTIWIKNILKSLLFSHSLHTHIKRMLGLFINYCSAASTVDTQTGPSYWSAPQITYILIGCRCQVWQA